MSQTTESSYASAAGPVTETERIITLDVLRGFALFGILMVNMAFFSMPFMKAVIDPSLAEAPLNEQLGYLFVKWLFEYKFVSLFSLLFGIGFIVQLSRARARGGPFVPGYLRRAGVLLVIGLVHALLLWYGDILAVYAVISLILLALASAKPRTLMILAAAALVVAIVMGMLIHGAQYAVVTSMAEQIAEQHDEARAVIEADDAPRGFQAMEAAGFDSSHPYWIHAETLAYREGPFADAMAFRAISYGIYIAVTVLMFGWHVLAMFLLGAALMKMNFFAPERHIWHRRLVMFALPAGLVLEGMHAASIWWSGFELSLASILLMPAHEIGSVLLMLGYVGAICLIVQRGALQWLTDAIASAGRMALTVYLSMTIIATGIMYWWGFGWFGSVSRTDMIGLAIAIYAVMIVACTLWLKAFRFGPMEWLWRVLTYLKLQPIRRST